MATLDSKPSTALIAATKNAQSVYAMAVHCATNRHMIMRVFWDDALQEWSPLDITTDAVNDKPHDERNARRGTNTGSLEEKVLSKF